MPEAEERQPAEEEGGAAGTPSRKAQSSLEGAPASPLPPSEETPADPGRESEEAAEVVEEDLDRLLDETKRERDEYLELAQRTRADFENYRKRMAVETEAAATRGRAQLAGDLIGVIDNLERALEAADLDAEAALNGEATSEQPLEQGVLLTYRELAGALRRAGVEPHDPNGESFDPSVHEAIGTRKVDGREPGEVVEVVQKGYSLNGQVLRAARVMVSE